MYDVVLLTLGDGDPHGACGADGDATPESPSGAGANECGDAHGCGNAYQPRPRVPVLACADALTAGGARVETVTVNSDTEIDTVLARLDGPPRADGLAWPDPDSKIRLVVATAADGQLRAVVRRLVRRYAPPPSRRPADLPATRTVPDLPAIGVLPLDPAGAGPGRDLGARDPAARDLAGQLGLPRDPASVAAAVLGGQIRRLDLLRTDGGSVTLDGALLGGADGTGRVVPWYGTVEVDDAVLSAGKDPLLACVVANAAGYCELSGVPLVTSADPADGKLEVAVAVPVVSRDWLGRRRTRLEVRRARGRAASITPRGEELPYIDDGVAGELSRKRAWWNEAGAWAVYSA